MSLKLTPRTDGLFDVEGITAEQLHALLAINRSATRAPLPVKYPNGRKHRKHRWLKTCDVCGEQFRGIRAVAIHRGRMHKNLPKFKRSPATDESIKEHNARLIDRIFPDVKKELAR